MMYEYKPSPAGYQLIHQKELQVQYVFGVQQVTLLKSIPIFPGNMNMIPPTIISHFSVWNSFYLHYLEKLHYKIKKKKTSLQWDVIYVKGIKIKGDLEKMLSTSRLLKKIEWDYYFKIGRVCIKREVISLFANPR